MDKEISVIIPTYNPDPDRFNQTLSGLKTQTLPIDRWELLIIDNNSSVDIAGMSDMSWHTDYRILSAPEQGLTFARLKGFSGARGSIIIMVDDDNILDSNYLERVSAIFKNNELLGAAGGKSLPLFEGPRPRWLVEFYGNLALRDLGEATIISSWNKCYPASAPVGAGMAIRRGALRSYLEDSTSGKRILSDRQGKSLSSGGDNDIVLHVLKAGYQAGYFPELSLTHIIPAARTTPAYLARLVNNTNKSWIQVLEAHEINPWKKIPAWTVPLRKLRAWFTYSAWAGELNYVRWRGACGTFDGLSANN